MFNKSFAPLAVLMISAAAFAQGVGPAPEQLGKVQRVEGLVTVSDGATIGNVVAGSPVMDGSRYVTSSSGSATLKLDNGCTIDLKPNRALTLQGRKNCDEVIAGIVVLDGNNAAFALLSNPLVGLGTIASAALISTARNNGGPISGQ